VVYWDQQLHKTKNPKQREKCKQAWQRAVHAWQADAFSATLPESELAWAEWMTKKVSSQFLGGRRAQWFPVADVSQWSWPDSKTSPSINGDP
jgi:hypothetical protein